MAITVVFLLTLIFSKVKKDWVVNHGFHYVKSYRVILIKQSYSRLKFRSDSSMKKAICRLLE